MKLIHADSGEVLLDNLEIADTFWKRFKGLQLRQSLPAGAGLLITPCSSVHTCFMRFPIDLIMLDEQNIVLGVKAAIQPWRLAICVRSTKRVIEVHSSHFNHDVAVGTQLTWSDTTPSTS
jgi:uncharacterized protein